MESNNHPGSKLLKAIDWTALIAKLNEKQPNPIPTLPAVLQRATDSLACVEQLIDGRWWSTMLGRHPDYPQSFYGLGRLLGQYPWIAKELFSTEDQGDVKARVVFDWYKQESRKAKDATERAADVQGIADAAAKAVEKRLKRRLPKRRNAPQQQPKQTIDEAMSEIMDREPEAHNWSLRTWRSNLKRRWSESRIQKSKTWTSIMEARKQHEHATRRQMKERGESL